MIHRILASDIRVLRNRQRKDLKPEDIQSLASSIRQNGLIAPVVVRQDSEGYVLVAGERRLKALELLWFFGDTVRCGEFQFADQEVPCLLQGEMDPDDAYEMELEENIRRVDLSWQERADAVFELNRRRTARALEKGDPPPSLKSLAEESHGTSGDSLQTTRDELMVAPYLNDPEIRRQSTVRDARKVLERREEAARSAEIARRVGASLSSLHELRLGDCLKLLPEIPDASFDVILTDPPYGIDADQFSDSGGRVAGAHFYDDSWTTWNNLMRSLAPETFRVTKPAAHLYLFCDVDNFVLLKGIMQEAGWRVFRTPLVWINPTSMRAPWPQQGPQRKYQLCLFAIKGDRPCNRLRPDVMEFPSDENLGHHAQKPVALYAELLSRSARPGDVVCDPFGGTGPILPAAHLAKCKAFYIEQDESAYGIAVTRLKELK